MDIVQIASEDLAAFHRQSVFLRRLAVRTTEVSTNGPDTEYGVYSFYADATGFKGGDAGHGGNAVVTIECDATVLGVRLHLDPTNSSYRDLEKAIADAKRTGSHEIAFDLDSGDKLTLCAMGDWEQGDLTFGLGRCFAKLARILGWA